MACNVSVVHQAMASAIAQPNKAPPQPSCAHLSFPSLSSSFDPPNILSLRPSPPLARKPVPNFLYGLVHVAAGDLLGAEIASGSENGRCAREYMEQGKLVPDEIVVMVGKI
ncbi:hypothetical protein DVH24_033354 [Malus domestica]|uniref:adenylate kinase n=1 Tax=Malus domestica TaxID=3750 RepID=A0A498J9U1_MALDO|nr:hypothetical protein DVH24_033354 [Malus domestica]